MELQLGDGCVCSSVAVRVPGPMIHLDAYSGIHECMPDAVVGADTYPVLGTGLVLISSLTA